MQARSYVATGRWNNVLVREDQEKVADVSHFVMGFWILGESVAVAPSHTQWSK